MRISGKYYPLRKLGILMLWYLERKKQTEFQTSYMRNRLVKSRNYFLHSHLLRNQSKSQAKEFIV